MKTFFILILFAMVFLTSCIKEEEVDKEKPKIDNSGIGSFPVNCDTLYFGDTFYFKAFFSDNVELGSYSIDIHHNFDHHSHSTDVSECSSDSLKPATNPLTFIQDYTLSAALKEVQINQAITLLSGNNKGLFEEGDYHFFISLTDKEGWSTQKGISIRILHH